ncbi:MAG: RagB/SusD family nutrient uptake outer membrane protein [Bacteroidales bacterium]|nr:RagB/SusD family nutrient uptake outer membrane protein [Bacteroidales bacterium]
MLTYFSLKAEALNELGQTQAADFILNYIALRASATKSSYTDKDDLREYILRDRAREFAFEGKRWFDVLRHAKKENFKRKQFLIDMVLGNADIQQRQILQTKVFDTMSYYLPIPENDLLYNQNLEQNPFYDR